MSDLIAAANDPSDTSRSATLRRKAGVVMRYMPLMGYFARRDLKAVYKRSILGWAWSLLNPLATVIVFSFVFSIVFRAEPPPTASGTTNFAVYLFSGLVAWTFFAALVTGAMQWLTGMGDLRRKVYFPPEAALFGSAIALAAQTAIELVVLVAIMILISNIGLTTLLVIPLMILIGLFGLGIGLTLSVINTSFRDVQYLVGIVLQALFFLTPIVYPPQSVPVDAWGGWPQRLVDINPVNQFVSSLRQAVYLLEWPSLSSWLIMTALALGTFSLGWWFFARNSMRLSEDM